MTDARLKSEWLNAMRFDALTDAAWRVFTGALMWSVDNGTDGAIPTRYLRMLHPDGAKPEAFAEIEKAGLWVATKDGFQLDDWDGALGQSTAAQVAAYKENAMKRARAYRERERAKLTKPKMSQPPVTGDVTRDVREHVGVGKGKGKGKGVEETVLSRFCAKHPNGTLDPCLGCRDARIQFEHAAISKPTPTPRFHECPTHPGWPHPESHAGCDRCKEDALSAAS